METSSSTSIISKADQTQAMPIIDKIATKPIAGQKMGTSGLRKRVREVKQPNYMENILQSIINALLQPTGGTGEVEWSSNRVKMMAIGGDGRYWNRQVIQLAISMLFANHDKFLRPRSDDRFTLFVARDGLMSTPAMSATIRTRGCNLGGIILTASHNMGGPDKDFGIKYNEPNGAPAQEMTTSRIHVLTQNIDHYFIARDFPKIDLSQIGDHHYGDTFVVRVIDPTEDYVSLLKNQVFDFPALKSFLHESKFKLLFDCMNSVNGIYANRIFVDELGLERSKCLMNDVPLEDFGGIHPDPNLIHAAKLVKALYESDEYDLGAASDGDGDRNMIVGNRFFVTPSDSVAIIAEHAGACIPWFSQGRSGRGDIFSEDQRESSEEDKKTIGDGKLCGVARSMPTSTALDRVAEHLGIKCFETPTGWKFFGNLMDSGLCSLCGEESFGTGSDHVREKDGIFAILAWISICAHMYRLNGNKKIVPVRDIVQRHWNKFGRSFYVRYDYEGVDAEAANRMIVHMRSRMSGVEDPMIAAAAGTTTSDKGLPYRPGQQFEGFRLDNFDDFEYLDPVDGTRSINQGLRFFVTQIKSAADVPGGDISGRIVFRLSGTSSTDSIVRIYLEKYVPYSDKTHDLIMNREAKEETRSLHAVALKLSLLKEFTGKDEPTVIT